MVPVLVPDAEDGHDVSMMQPRRRLCLPLEPSHLLRVQERPGREHLHGHAAAQALLLRLEDDPHATPADLAEDAVVAQTLQPDANRRPLISGQRAGGGAGALAQVLHHEQGREQVADLVGQLGVPLDVLAERGMLAAALAVEELLGRGSSTGLRASLEVLIEGSSVPDPSFYSLCLRGRSPVLIIRAMASRPRL